MKILSNQLLDRLREQHCKGRIVSARHTLDLKSEIENRLKEGEFDLGFYRLRLSFFDFSLPATLLDAKSIVIIAVPRPQAQATFMFEGKKVPIIIPPTYVGYKKTNDVMEEFLSVLLAKEGYKITKALLPLKLLAAKSRLAKYGRNNITYIEGMGSFYELVAYYSDLPCENDSWQEVQTMEKCARCQACAHACPTGAIAEDRFLLHADRCITYHNEMKGTVSFPNWLDVSWHNALVGCLRCQKVCPEDRPFLNWIGEKEEFSEDETEQLLSGTILEEISEPTLKKLQHLDLADAESLDNLPRNLEAIFKSLT